LTGRSVTAGVPATSRLPRFSWRLWESRVVAVLSGRGWSAIRRSASGQIGRRGLRVSAVVGTILTTINEGPTVVAGHAEWSLIPRAVLNYVVPFCVSCYSSAAAERRPVAQPGAGAVDDADIR
jgi:hypothetical protein